MSALLWQFIHTSYKGMFYTIICQNVSSLKKPLHRVQFVDPCVTAIFPGTARKAHWKFHIDKSYTHCSRLTLDFLSTVPTDDWLITAWTTQITWNVIFLFKYTFFFSKKPPKNSNNSTWWKQSHCWLHTRVLSAFKASCHSLFECLQWFACFHFFPYSSSTQIQGFQCSFLCIT